MSHWEGDVMSHWGMACDLLDDFKRGEVSEEETINLLGQIDPWFHHKRIREQQAELEARRCHECDYFPGCPIYDTARSLCGQRSVDFECSRWAAREEET